MSVGEALAAPSKERDGRQACGVCHAKAVHRGHEQAANRRKRLRVAQHLLAPRRLGKELREPRHSRDELDADADEYQTAQEQQHLDARGKSGRERRAGVDQDAEGQDTPAAKQIGQVAAEQPEDAAGEGRDIKQAAHPHLELRRPGRGSCELDQRRPDNQRQHQNLVDVEREADRGHRADQPLDGREARSDAVHCTGFHGCSQRNRQRAAPGGDRQMH